MRISLASINILATAKIKRATAIPISFARFNEPKILRQNSNLDPDNTRSGYK
jgi:hypothetical protein